MGETLSTYDAMLKEDYLPPVIDALPKKIELYSKLRKNPYSWTGNKIIQPVNVLDSKSGGARADGENMPAAGNQTVVEHQTQVKYNYAKIQVTGPAMAASKNDKGAFARAVAFAMQKKVKWTLNDIDRQMYRDGTGTLAIVETGTASATQELDWAGSSSGAISGQDGTRFLRAGYTLVAGTAAELGTGGSGVAGTVSSITDGDTVVFTSSITTVTDDLVVFGDSAAVADNTYNKEIQGLDTAMITTGTYQNVNVGNYADFAAQVHQHSTPGTNRTLTQTLMQAVIDAIDYKSDGKVDLIVTNTYMRPQYLDLVLGDKRFLSTKGLDAGYTGALDYNGIPILFAKNCPYNRFYFLDTSTWLVCEQRPLHWFEDDGAILNRTSGDAVEALLRYYMNLRCENPSCNGVLKDITQSTY